MSQIVDLGNGAQVICGNVYDIPAMKLQPALIAADPPYGDITKETWDTADVDGWLKLFRDFDYLGEGIPIYWWGGIGKIKNRPFLEFALRLEKETDWCIKDWITWKKKRAYGKPKDYLFVREECLVCTYKGSPYKVFNKPYLAEKRGYAGYKSNIVIGKFEGIFHEKETCSVLPSGSQTQSERDVSLLLRQNDLLEKSRSKNEETQKLVKQEQGASQGILKSLGQTKSDQEDSHESASQGKIERYFLQSDGKRLAGGVDQRVPGVWDANCSPILYQWTG